jgi:hypothetical protein
MTLDIEIHCTTQKVTTGRETIDVHPDETVITVGDSQLFVCHPHTGEPLAIKLEPTEYVTLKFH